MKSHDVQTIELEVSAGQVFAFIADPRNLPEWTNAFSEVGDGSALLETPAGAVPVKLRVGADETAGTVDWFMTFPDGSLAVAYSRVVPLSGERSLYAFTLTPPPVPLEALEGALAEQSRILGEELIRLKTLVESR